MTKPLILRHTLAFSSHGFDYKILYYVSFFHGVAKLHKVGGFLPRPYFLSYVSLGDDMKRLLIVVLCVLVMPAMATHIVGGEFEIVHLNGNSYRVNLILYFDQLNGAPGARDPNFTTAIFRKRDNQLMENVFFQGLYRNECRLYAARMFQRRDCYAEAGIQHESLPCRIRRYNDPQGYYIIWERCCRNYTITNIYSEDPAFSSRAAGQTFYLEFPPVVKNGEPFINSSPRLFPPLNDYACPRKPYYVDFAGVDDDGDSLAYSLVTPLTTHTLDRDSTRCFRVRTRGAMAATV